MFRKWAELRGGSLTVELGRNMVMIQNRVAFLCLKLKEESLCLFSSLILGIWHGFFLFFFFSYHLLCLFLPGPIWVYLKWNSQGRCLWSDSLVILVKLGMNKPWAWDNLPLWKNLTAPASCVEQVFRSWARNILGHITICWEAVLCFVRWGRLARIL